MPALCKNTIIAIFICAILVLIGYCFVDKPVAFFMASHHFSHFKILLWLTWLAPILSVLAVLIYIYYLIKYAYKAIGFHDQVLLALANSVVIANAIKDVLKAVFGRYWPNTWVNNNLSLIRDNAYGFHLLHGGAGYASFPSGHTTVSVAAMTIVWLAYPKLRIIAIVIPLLVITGLLGSDYHFVTDIIAGGFLGAITAVWVAKISKLTKA